MEKRKIYLRVLLITHTRVCTYVYVSQPAYAYTHACTRKYKLKNKTVQLGKLIQLGAIERKKERERKTRKEQNYAKKKKNAPFLHLHPRCLLKKWQAEIQMIQAYFRQIHKPLNSAADQKPLLVIKRQIPITKKAPRKRIHVKC